MTSIYMFPPNKTQYNNHLMVFPANMDFHQSILSGNQPICPDLASFDVRNGSVMCDDLSQIMTEQWHECVMWYIAYDSMGFY